MERLPFNLESEETEKALGITREIFEDTYKKMFASFDENKTFTELVKAIEEIVISNPQCLRASAMFLAEDVTNALMEREDVCMHFIANTQVGNA